jgi:hypothetical protein
VGGQRMRMPTFIHRRLLQFIAALIALLAGGEAAAFTVPADGTWHWYDAGTTPAVSGLTCVDGSSTGLAVSRPATGGNGRVLIFLDGGGGCWDGSKAPCKTPPLPPLGYVAATFYNAASFASDESQTGDVNFTTPFAWAKPALGAASCSGTCSGRGIFDRTATDTANPSLYNPFANYTYVFLPYCSGDLWQGSKIDNMGSTFRTPATATNQAGATNPAVFEGATNFANAIAYIKSVLPTPVSIALVGGSAGGFGAYFNYGQLRAAYPSTSIPISVVSDSSGGFWSGTPNPLSPSTWTREGFFLSTPAASPNASYLEDYFADAWDNGATAHALFPSLTTTMPTGAHVPFYRQQDIYVAAVGLHPTVDNFGVLLSSADWLLPAFFNWQTNPLNPAVPGASPNANDAINDFALNVQLFHSNVYSLNVSSTTTPAPALSVALGGLRPWSEHHTHLGDDVTLWTAQSSGGNGVFAFLQSMHIPY